MAIPGLSIAAVALMLLSSGLQILRFGVFLIDFVCGGFLPLAIAINVARDRSRQR
jgi:simple sugar transport system permease protein